MEACKPRYEHDCDRCVFLGQFEYFDLYFCHGEPTLVCRYGNDGPEYCSGLDFALCLPDKDHLHYAEALFKALQIPECKQRILSYYKRDATFPRLEEFVKIAETPSNDLPLLIHDIKHIRPFYEFKLKEVL